MNDQPPISTTNESPKPKRRWFQFSLRTLLVMMLVFGCGFGMGVRIRRGKNVKLNAYIQTLPEVLNDPRLPPQPRCIQFVFGDEAFRNALVLRFENINHRCRPHQRQILDTPSGTTNLLDASHRFRTRKP